MDEVDKQKTAFISHMGLFHFNVMPFGLSNAPQTFQRLMNGVLSGLTWEECLVYLDDVIIYSRTFEEHLERLEHVFERLKESGLKIKLEKCKFLATEVHYLGHVVSEQGVRPDPTKTKCIAEYPTPKNADELRSFLGLASYYRRFIKNFAKTANNLYRLTITSTPFIWLPAHENSFQELKKKLISAPTLAFPDFSKPFKVETDACDYGIGAILSQNIDGYDQPIVYYSRSLSKAEQKYFTTEKEALAIIVAVKQLRPYLYGREFTIVTDHKPLQWLESMKNPPGRVARWIMELQEHNFKVEYKAGKKHVNADALSRIPERCNLLTTEDLPLYEVIDICGSKLDELKVEQEKDEELGQVLTALREGETVGVVEFSKSVPHQYKQIYPNLVLKDSIICKKRNKHDSNLVVVVPKVMQIDIMYQLHATPISGHLA